MLDIDINKRIRELRDVLNISQESFGNSIGLSKSGISNIENGTRNVTEKHILLINTAFNVNEKWLRTGEGEMFIEKDSTIISTLSTDYDLDSVDVEIVKGYLELGLEQRKAIKNYVRSVASAIAHEEIAVTKDEEIASDEDDIDRELKAYHLELQAEKKATTLSANE